MGNKAVGGAPMIVKFVPVHFVIQQMRKRTVEENTLIIKFVPVQFLTQQMCEEGILKDSTLINI